MIGSRGGPGGSGKELDSLCRYIRYRQIGSAIAANVMRMRNIPKAIGMSCEETNGGEGRYQAIVWSYEVWNFYF
jgi:hypothetical protein